MIEYLKGRQNCETELPKAENFDSLLKHRATSIPTLGQRGKDESLRILPVAVGPLYVVFFKHCIAISNTLVRTCSCCRQRELTVITAGDLGVILIPCPVVFAEPILLVVGA